MKRLLATLLTAFCAQAAHSAVIYNTWSSNEPPDGSYVLTVTEDSGALKFNLTVDPWDAEALGLFVDLGDQTVPFDSVSVTDISPAGQVALFATDTTSSDCGQGCNLQGSGLTNEWELVFQLGAQGFDGIQTFSFTVSSTAFDFTESMLGTVGIRAQQLCNPGQTLPTGDCPGSDKVWGEGTPTDEFNVPEPGMAGLLGLGAIALGFAGMSRRRA
jgi:hypothetical protein